MKNYVYNLYQMYNKMNDQEILFSYKGPVSHNVLVAVGNTIRQSFSSQELKNTIIKKIFSIFVEEAQNVLRYSLERQNDPVQNTTTGVGLVGVGKTATNDYFVFSGNIISTSIKAGIIEKINHINSLNKEELRAYFNKQRKEGTLNNKGGAGLGFIDMARKSGAPIEFNFIDLEDGQIFFEVTVKIPIQ